MAPKGSDHLIFRRSALLWIKESNLATNLRDDGMVFFGTVGNKKDNMSASQKPIPSSDGYRPTHIGLFGLNEIYESKVYSTFIPKVLKKQGSSNTLKDWMK